MQSEKVRKLAKAARLAFEYIGDRSAGSSEAWDVLEDALGLDQDDESESCFGMIECLLGIENGGLE